MIDDKDPPRLLDSGEIPDELRRGLEGLRAHVPTGAQMAALSDRIGIKSTPPAPGAPPIGSPVLAKALIGGVVALGGAGLFLLLRSREPKESHLDDRARTSVVVTPSASAAAAVAQAEKAGGPANPSTAHAVEEVPSVREETDTNAPKPRVGEPGAAAPAAPPRPTSETPTSSGSGHAAPKATAPTGNKGAPAPDTATSSESEIAILRDARATLPVDPAGALEITERHRTTFPRGALVQEREIIAITALVKLGRPDAARKRAEQFRALYPRSAYLIQLERILPKP